MTNKETYTKAEVAELLEWTISNMEKAQTRYIRAEDFLLEFAEKPWYTRWFFGNTMIYEFVKSIHEK